MLISEEIGPRHHHHVFFRNEFSSQMELNRGGFTGGKGERPPRPVPRWGSLQRSPRTPSWLGGGWLPPPQEPHPRSWPYGPRISALRASHLGPSGLVSAPPRQQILKTPL